MPADRSVKVRLEANISQYQMAMLAAAAETHAFAAEGDKASTQMRSFEQSAGSAGKEIDKLSGRLGLFLDVAASVGPSLIPISAVGIPAVTGLASSLGFAAIGAGAVAASMYGVSDALKALNTYALKPTDTNLANVENTLGKLAPDAQQFVLKLRSLGPELKAIRDAGAGELFPHWTDAIDSLTTLLPTVEGLVSRVAQKVGQVSERGAKALAGPEWTDFFAFLEKETPKAIGALSTATGHLAHAAVQLWMATTPLNHDFLDVLVKGTTEIDAWATGLSKTQGFQEFLSYVETNGPKVGDLLGSIAMALVQIVEAGAPIGAAVLPVLTALADIIGTIADSDLGTPLLALLALSRGAALLGRGIDSGPVKSVRGFTADLKTMASTSVVAWGRAESETMAYNRASERVRGTLTKTAGAMAGVALITSGATDALGLSQTAMLGVTGAMVGGVPGAVAGGLIGLFEDFRHGVGDASDSVKAYNDLLDHNASSVASYANAVSGALAQVNAASSMVPTNLGDQLLRSIDPQNIKLNLAALFGGLDDTALGKAGIQANQLEAQYGDLSLALNQVGQSLGMIKWGQATTDLTALQGILNRAQPAMQALGITTADLAEAARDGSLMTLVDRIRKWTVAADSAKGRTESVAKAIADLGEHALTTSEKADALKASLDALLGPGLDLSAATDAWRAGLRHLDDELDKHNKSLIQASDAGDKNREVIRGRVTDLMSMLHAEAAAGDGPKKLAASLRQSRQALIEQGVAAGLSRKELGAYLDQLGLTPKSVKTIIEAVHADAAKKDAKDVKAEYDKLPSSVTTDLRVDNHQALAATRATQAALNAVRDKVVMLTVQHNDVRLGAAGHRASGGPVVAGQSYIVGENRPELFVPNVSGRIVPNLPTSSGSGGHSSAQDLSGLIAVLAGLLQGQGAIGKTAKQRAADEKQIQKALHDFAPKFSQGLAGVTSEVHDFRRAVREAGHKWTEAMQEQADKLIEAARAHDIGKALKKFDVDVKDGADGVRSEIHDLRSAIRDAGGTWTDQMSSKAHRLTKIANAYDLATQALSDSQASLASILDQQAAFAQQVGQSQSSDPFGHGLAGFTSTVASNTANTSMFTDVLKKLADEGLDGPLFQALAASGDLKTAIQLLNAGPEAIDAAEKAYTGMLGSQTTLGSFAGDQAYGSQVAAAQTVVDNNTAALANLDKRLERQEAKFDRMVAAVESLPNQVHNGSHRGTYQGAYDGIKDSVSGAGRQLARNG